MHRLGHIPHIRKLTGYCGALRLSAYMNTGQIIGYSYSCSLM